MHTCSFILEFTQNEIYDGICDDTEVKFNEEENCKGSLNTIDKK